MMSSQGSSQLTDVVRSRPDSKEVEEYFTDEVVDVICSADLSRMRSSLLEEVLNQKKQELLANADLSHLLSTVQKQRQEETLRGKTHSHNRGSSRDTSESDFTRIPPTESEVRQTPDPLPIDLTSPPETAHHTTSVGDRRPDTRLLDESHDIDSRVLLYQTEQTHGDQCVNHSTGTENVVPVSDSRPPSSHISVHPSVYVLNRRTGSKTQAKPS